nr:hypothetical protein [Bradyrhizobium cenepequi]
MDSDTGRVAFGNLALAADCVRHARMVFNCPDLNLATAAPGSFTLSPNRQMAVELSCDYAAMVGMIFGNALALEDVLGGISELEARINDTGAKSAAAS